MSKTIQKILELLTDYTIVHRREFKRVQEEQFEPREVEYGMAKICKKSDEGNVREYVKEQTREWLREDMKEVENRVKKVEAIKKGKKPAMAKFEQDLEDDIKENDFQVAPPIDERKSAKKRQIMQMRKGVAENKQFRQQEPLSLQPNK